MINRELFRVHVSNCHEQLKEVVSATPKAAWFSTDPEGMNVLHADCVLSVAAVESVSWARIELENGWSRLLSCRRLLVRRIGEGNPWMLSLGDLLGCVGIGWPAKPHFLKGALAWAEPDLDGLPTWLLVTNPDE